MVRVTLPFALEPGKPNITKEHPEGVYFDISKTGVLSIVGKYSSCLAVYAPHSWAVAEVIE